MKHLINLAPTWATEVLIDTELNIFWFLDRESGRWTKYRDITEDLVKGDIEEWPLSTCHGFLADCRQYPTTTYKSIQIKITLENI